MRAPVHGDEQRAAAELDVAADLAARGDLTGAAGCALHGATLLPPGHADRWDALLLAAQLLGAAGDHAAAAEVWVTAAAVAPDDALRASALTGQGDAARRSGALARAEAALADPVLIAAERGALAGLLVALGQAVRARADQPRARADPRGNDPGQAR